MDATAIALLAVGLGLLSTFISVFAALRAKRRKAAAATSPDDRVVGGDGDAR